MESSVKLWHGNGQNFGKQVFIDVSFVAMTNKNYYQILNLEWKKNLRVSVMQRETVLVILCEQELASSQLDDYVPCEFSVLRS